jgi:hypothetical protein
MNESLFLFINSFSGNNDLLDHWIIENDFNYRK